jgi:predicted AlkP superfamily pyrophosphatase or phosphodiesterase
MIRLRPVLLAALMTLTALPACAQGRRRPAVAAVPPVEAAPVVAPELRPKLVLFLTVDQLRPDYLERWDAQLTGGLRTLIDGGIFFSKGVHDHAITETAPGHASTMSGRFPYSTGISSNSAGVNTSSAPLVDSEGVGASPFRFTGTTLADWMVAADSRTRVLSVSRKDRSAILPIGRGKYPVFWYAQRSGFFTTSTWYADTLPVWVREFNAEDRAATMYAGRTWDLLLGADAYPEPDSVEAESNGQDFQMPHFMPNDSALARQLIIGQPWMDQMTLDFAWRGVRAMDLGAGPQTDLLAVSLSTTDAVGHRFGPDSRELHDQILRLDRELGVFLDSLFALRGRENVVITLTGDHGVAPVPEVASSWGDNRTAMRVSESRFTPIFNEIASMVQRAEIPLDAFSFDFPAVEVDRTKAVGKERELLQIARTFAASARRIPGVMRVDVIDDLARADTVTDDIARRWLHMFRPGGNAIIGITLDPFNYIGSGVASHGTPHDYDARVPVLFFGSAFRRGKDEGAARVVDMAPTLAHLLGLTPSERLDGQVLGRAFVPAPE